MTARLRATALAAVVIAAAFDSASASADQAGRPRCLMQAPPAVYALPPTGFIDADEPDK